MAAMSSKIEQYKRAQQNAEIMANMIPALKSTLKEMDESGLSRKVQEF